jgi:hypothetical protein
LDERNDTPVMSVRCVKEDEEEEVIADEVAE